MEWPLDRLLGRVVAAGNGRVVGRLEEVRVDDTVGWRISAYVIGKAGLLERLGVGGRRLVGARTGGYVARHDQLDVSDPERPHLRCPIDDLQRL